VKNIKTPLTNHVTVIFFLINYQILDIVGKRTNTYDLIRHSTCLLMVYCQQENYIVWNNEYWVINKLDDWCCNVLKVWVSDKYIIF
jgi:hypothetical protein